VLWLGGGAPGGGARGGEGRGAPAGLKVPVRAARGRGVRRGLRGGIGGAALGEEALLSGGTVAEGYFSARVRLGSPPSDFDLVVDTGSAVTYAPCASCGPRCGEHRGGRRLDPARSSSSSPVPCVGAICGELCSGGHGCTCTGVHTLAGAAAGRLGIWEPTCGFESQYAEGSGVSGPVLTERLSFEESIRRKEEGGGARVVVGCATKEGGDLYTQDADGILGLSDSPLSVHNQLVAQGVLEDVFAICFGAGESEADEGYLVLGSSGLGAAGEGAGTDATWVPMVRKVGSHFYGVNLTEVSVQASTGGSVTRIPVPSSSATILDSGTTYAYLEPTLYNAIRTSIEGGAKARLTLRNSHNLCWEVQSARLSAAATSPFWDRLAASFPEVTLGFSGSVKQGKVEAGAGAPTEDRLSLVRLRPQNYLFLHPDDPGQVCLGIFSAGLPGADSLLGGIIGRDMLVVYDKARSKIGFAPTICSAHQGSHA